VSTFQKASGNWTKYRSLNNLKEVDFHWADQRGDGTYYEKMAKVWDVALESLVEAQKAGHQYLLYTHGHSTSRIGKTTSRSQIRKLMRSKEATPYIVRSQCEQHDSVFLAVLKPLTVDTTTVD